MSGIVPCPDRWFAFLGFARTRAVRHIADNDDSPESQLVHTPVWDSTSGRSAYTRAGVLCNVVNCPVELPTPGQCQSSAPTIRAQGGSESSSWLLAPRRLGAGQCLEIAVVGVLQTGELLGDTAFTRSWRLNSISSCRCWFDKGQGS